MPFDLLTKREQIKIQSILKLVSFENLAGNDFSERSTQAEAHREKKPQSPTVKYWTKNIASLFKEFFVAIIIS